jgi:hydrogenase maturation protein HypF
MRTTAQPSALSADGAGAERATRRRVRIDLSGRVQGVGFRPQAHRLAVGLGLAGGIANRRGGVRIEVEGAGDAIERFLARLRRLPEPVRIESLRQSELPPVEAEGFYILASDLDDGTSPFLPLDRAVCDNCLREWSDPAERRFGYPFLGCSACGPRFTTVEALPYDRGATTMRAFTMCPACAAEYADPSDRRFHLQSNACAACGPVCMWTGSGGAGVRGEAALSAAGEALRRGGVIAVKGVGGFHLMTGAATRPASRNCEASSIATRSHLRCCIRICQRSNTTPS